MSSEAVQDLTTVRILLLSAEYLLMQLFLSERTDS
jgi:hypothetical protein